MLTNYFKIAFRALRKHPGYAAINVGGLGLGLACCFMIVLFIQHERSFDRFHENGDRVYRFTINNRSADELRAFTPAGLAPLIEDNVGGIGSVIRYANMGRPYVSVEGGEPQRLDRFNLADAGFFNAFSFEFVQGDRATALANPSDIVVTETQAKALFGSADPMGQVVNLDEFPLTVSGVIKDLPENTHFAFSVLGSFQHMGTSAGPEALEDLTNWNYRTYVLLDAGANPETVAEEATTLIAERLESPEMVAGMQPLASLRFETQIADYDLPTRNPQVLWIFAAIAALVLLIACVNFTNLATARATQRAREVGVRKSLGAGRRQLVLQFLGESVLLSVVAIGVGLAGVALGLPFFNDALGGTTALNLGHPATLAGLAGIGLAAGLLAGTYPAFYLTHFNASRVLKGDLSTSGGAPAFRKGLIVAQFAISAFLIVATLTVVNQLQFMRSQDLGFAEEQVVTFQPTSDIWSQYDSFKQSLLDSPDVVGVAAASGLPGSVGMSRGFYWPGGPGEEEVNESLTTLMGGPDYLDTVGLELVDGRWFRDGEADVDNSYLLNETAVRQLGMTDPVGTAFRAWDGDESGMIIGVVKDFHYAGLRYAIEPLVIQYKPEWLGQVAVRFAAGSIAPGVEHLQGAFARAAPGYTLDYRFLDEDIERQYREETRLSTLLTFFAGVAVFIACLGIFGLAALAAERRRREIGVRKVLGASVQSLMTMLAGDFVKLVVVAFVVAAPLAYIAMNRWLEGFAYTAGIGPGVFVLAGMGVLMVALLTVSTQTLRAAMTDPVRALRSD